MRMNNKIFLIFGIMSFVGGLLIVTQSLGLLYSFPLAVFFGGIGVVIGVGLTGCGAVLIGNYL